MFPLVVHAVDSKLPIGSAEQEELTEESLTAYEVGYTGTFNQRATADVAFYITISTTTSISLSFRAHVIRTPPPIRPIGASGRDDRGRLAHGFGNIGYCTVSRPSVSSM